ncbi:MAG: CPBP family intramembrane glutamic endopeptidase [Sulfitobacter sp.]
MSGYRAHEAFIEPARNHPALWRFAVGMVVAVFVFFITNAFYWEFAFAFCEGIGGLALQDLQAGQTPLAMYILLFSFGFMAVGVGISARLLQDRSFFSLLGPLPLLRRDFRLVSLAVLSVLALVLLLPPWDMGGDFVPNLPIATWLALLLPSLFFVLIQVSAEEIVFRGYIQQQLAARFRSPLIWMVLPSALFALGHYLPESAGDNALLIAVWAWLFGMLMADLTARSGSLGPAIAVHLWNNVSAMVIISLPEDLSGLALYLTPFGMEDTAALRDWLVVDFAMMFVLWLAARVAIRR